MSDVDGGRIVSDGTLTLGQLLDHWLAKAVPNRNLQQSTIEVHRWACGILRDELGGRRLEAHPRPDRSGVRATGQRRALAQLTIKLRSTLSQALA